MLRKVDLRLRELHAAGGEAREEGRKEMKAIFSCYLFTARGRLTIVRAKQNASLLDRTGGAKENRPYALSLVCMRLRGP